MSFNDNLTNMHDTYGMTVTKANFQYPSDPKFPDR